MTNKYKDLRAALADAQSADSDCVMPVIEIDTLRALLADYDRMRDALLWAAGALQMACAVDVVMGEADGISINNETRTVVQILDAADAALAQEGS